MPETKGLARETELKAEIARLQDRLQASAAREAEERRAAEAEHARLTFELGHRVKNTLSVVQALASQTMRSADTKEQALDSFGDRIMALSRANDAILSQSWTTASVRSVAESVLAPFMHEGRLSIDGPETRLNASAALSFAMALHELAANAKRHGAWSVEGGHVDLRWTVTPCDAEGGFTLCWRESGGPPVQPQTPRKFGLRMMDQSLKSAFGRDLRLEFAPDGLVCEVRAPVSRLAQ